MRDFTSYFIGIPLPGEFQKDYEALLCQANVIDPNIKTVNPLTSHITVYYLDKFPTLIPAHTAELLKSKINLLANSQITVSGFGSFGGQNPKTLFLAILCPTELKQFRKSIFKILAKNSAQDNSMPFYPHMTIAVVKAENYEKNFIHFQPQLKALLDNVTWTFTITELVIYGVDSIQSPEYQEKLVVIPIN